MWECGAMETTDGCLILISALLSNLNIVGQIKVCGKIKREESDLFWGKVR